LSKARTVVSIKRCILCDIEWDEKENPGFDKIHKLSELHVKNSIHKDMRKKTRRKRHALLRKKRKKQQLASWNEMECKLPSI